MISRPRHTVAILGGGLCGAATAYHLAHLIGPDAAEIRVVEPRADLGRGLAYDTSEPAHRINVPASRMTLVSDQPDHFEAWLASARVDLSPGTATERGDLFPERSVFGRYVAAHLEPLLAAGTVRHLRMTATGLYREGARYRIELSDETGFDADLVVLAMSHPLPGLPAELRGLAGSPLLVADPYDSARIAEIAPDAAVLVVGTGLTSADVIASLHRRGFRGRIAAVSRRGQRSRGHAPVARTSDADFATDPAPTALALLRRLRAAVAADAAAGHSWHAVLDRMREQGQTAWAALDAGERARLVRHLRAYWDVHRFRIAPQVEAVLDSEVARGHLTFRAARLVAAEALADGIHVTLRPAGQTAPMTERYDVVVVTTGPSHGDILRSNPALRSAAAAGLVAADPLGLGLHVARHCHAVDAEGAVSETLFVVGPLARGDVGELMGVPEVTRHAESVAAALADRISSP